MINQDNSAQIVDVILFIALIALIIISGYFSGSETSMMSLNRYRLRHMAKHHHRSAKRCHSLLQRPDRLLGMILLGNTFANILASALATILASHYFGDLGIAVATVGLTLVVLIFAEVMPKTIAAYYPEGFAFPASVGLQWLLKLLYPLIWIINAIASLILRPFGIRVSTQNHDHLSPEELRSVVDESTGKLTGRRRNMLLSVLDLEKVTMTHCMIPRTQVYALNIDQNWSGLIRALKHSPYSKVPVYRGELNNIIGMLRLRKVIEFIDSQSTSKAQLEKLIEPAYFVPESTTLQQQLLNFQKNAEDIAIVVDEYGDIQGLVTVEDIVEEIVGEFTNVTQPTANDYTKRQADGSYVVDGTMTVRDVNRDLQLKLPTDGPTTLNGLITEYLEAIPTSATCLKIEGTRIEILRVKDKAVKWAKILPKG